MPRWRSVAECELPLWSQAQATASAAASTPSLFAYWRELLLLLAAYGVVLGAVAKAVFDDQFIGAWDRSSDRIKARIDGMYALRIKRVDDAVSLTDTHNDRLDAFEESLLQQGRALSEKVGDHFAQSADAMKAITLVLGEMQKEIASTAKDVARLRGYVEAAEQWNGHERRFAERRRADLEDSHGDSV